MLKEKNAVTTSALVELFGVSIETVRRDLLEMEQNGLLIRVHGGAVLNSDMKPYMNLPDRNKMQVEQKNDLALNAMKYAKENKFDYVLIDTAGRLHIDEELMAELDNIKNEVKRSFKDNAST